MVDDFLKDAVTPLFPLRSISSSMPMYVVLPTPLAPNTGMKCGMTLRDSADEEIESGILQRQHRSLPSEVVASQQEQGTRSCWIHFFEIFLIFKAIVVLSLLV